MINSLLKKLTLGVVLTLVTYKVSQVYYKNTQGNTPPSSPPPNTRSIIVDEINFEQINTRTSSPNKLKRELKRYLYTLSPLQTSSVIRQMGLSNILTSKTAQKEFLKCAAPYILQKNSMPPSHQYCKNMSFQSSGPVVALGSIAGSGNSWVRQLLESATGIYTGAVYCDPAYIEQGMIGEGITSGNVIAVKTHSSPIIARSRIINLVKAIYIVRSPFGSILSENNRMLAKQVLKQSNGTLQRKERHTLEIDYNYANNSDWEAKVRESSNRWGNVVRQWLNVKKFPVLIVGYENLMKDTYTELKRMLDFIGFSYTEDDLLCAINNSGEIFHRNHTKKYLINPYSPELQEIVLNQIKKLDKNLRAHNISIYHHYEV